jgi:alkanesulfonate monooxygenase SsuD/methylene tetrahydromethanopterin reductase-like flavin-dependent oxidoreductase (luciferase family)
LGGTSPTFQHPGKPANDKERAVLLDEGLDLLDGLWRGQPFSYEGQYYRAQSAHFLPAPVQSPRIPIWVGGWWPRKAPFRRAARWDGVFPLAQAVSYLTDMLAPAQLAEIIAYVRAYRDNDTPFDIIQLGLTQGKNPVEDAAIVAPYQQAGATWWLENINPARFPGLSAARERIDQGPPRI